MYVFTQSNMTFRFNVFEFKFGKNINFFESSLTKILLFDLIALFLLTCCLFRIRQNNRLFSSLSSNLQHGSKCDLVVFYREFTKLATDVQFFVLVAVQCSRFRGRGRWRARAPYSPNDCLCLPHFGLLRMLFGASLNDKTTGNNRRRKNNVQK